MTEEQSRVRRRLTNSLHSTGKGGRLSSALWGGRVSVGQPPTGLRLASVRGRVRVVPRRPPTDSDTSILWPRRRAFARAPEMGWWRSWRKGSGRRKRRGTILATARLGRGTGGRFRSRPSGSGRARADGTRWPRARRATTTVRRMRLYGTTTTPPKTRTTHRHLLLLLRCHSVDRRRGHGARVAKRDLHVPSSTTPSRGWHRCRQRAIPVGTETRHAGNSRARRRIGLAGSADFPRATDVGRHERPRANRDDFHYYRPSSLRSRTVAWRLAGPVAPPPADRRLREEEEVVAGSCGVRESAGCCCCCCCCRGWWATS